MARAFPRPPPTHTNCKLAAAQLDHRPLPESLGITLMRVTTFSQDLILAFLRGLVEHDAGLEVNSDVVTALLRACVNGHGCCMGRLSSSRDVCGKQKSLIEALGFVIMPCHAFLGTSISPTTVSFRVGRSRRNQTHCMLLPGVAGTAEADNLVVIASCSRKTLIANGLTFVDGQGVRVTNKSSFEATNVIAKHETPRAAFAAHVRLAREAQSILQALNTELNFDLTGLSWEHAIAITGTTGNPPGARA